MRQKTYASCPKNKTTLGIRGKTSSHANAWLQGDDRAQGWMLTLTPAVRHPAASMCAGLRVREESGDAARVADFAFDDGIRMYQICKLKCNKSDTVI